MPSPFRPVALMCSAALLLGTACSRVPDIENQLTKDLRNAPYPALLPLNSVFATPDTPAASPAQQGAALEQDLSARAARLRARAAALNAAQN